MKIPYQNIYKVLRTNRFIVLTSVICSAVVCIISVVMVIWTCKKKSDSFFKTYATLLN